MIEWFNLIVLNINYFGLSEFSLIHHVWLRLPAPEDHVANSSHIILKNTAVRSFGAHSNVGYLLKSDHVCPPKNCCGQPNLTCGSLKTTSKSWYTRLLMLYFRDFLSVKLMYAKYKFALLCPKVDILTDISLVLWPWSWSRTGLALIPPNNEFSYENYGQNRTETKFRFFFN